MDRFFSEKLRVARKVHLCNACYWLLNSDLNDSDMLPEEIEHWKQAKASGMKIQPGETYLEQIGIYEGKPITIRSKPEIHEICIKHDIYVD